MTMNQQKNDLIIVGYVIVWLLTGLTSYSLVPYLFLGLLLILLLDCKALLKTWFLQLTRIQVLKGVGFALLALIIEVLGFWLAVMSNIPVKSTENNNALVQEVLKYPIYIAYIALIAPILEELVFRYALFNRINNWIYKGKFSIKTGVILSIVLTSVLFSLVHGTLELPYILMGIYLQWIYLKNDNVLVNMFTHIVINSATLILILVNTKCYY